MQDFTAYSTQSSLYLFQSEMYHMFVSVHFFHVCKVFGSW